MLFNTYQRLLHLGGSAPSGRDNQQRAANVALLSGNNCGLIECCHALSQMGVEVVDIYFLLRTLKHYVRTGNVSRQIDVSDSRKWALSAIKR